MKTVYRGDRGEVVLEEYNDRGIYRWPTIEPKRLCSGFVNPGSFDEALDQHHHVLDLAPFALSLGSLDCESLNVMFGFDFTYRGNHNQLLIDALGVAPGFERLAEMPGATIICNEPSLQFSLDEECRVQCRLSIETRTTAYHVRTGEYPEEQLSVYLTARRYGSMDPGETYVDAMNKLAVISRDVVDAYVIDQILRPLQQTIAIK
ncbi:MAG: hypothetical protein QGG36_28525 [Pirellulaceae bacterium]|nr:hypothetical protein [Pirellulaceae bacterium]